MITQTDALDAPEMSRTTLRNVIESALLCALSELAVARQHSAQIPHPRFSVLEVRLYNEIASKIHTLRDLNKEKQ